MWMVIELLCHAAMCPSSTSHVGVTPDDLAWIRSWKWQDKVRFCVYMIKGDVNLFRARDIRDSTRGELRLYCELAGGETQNSRHQTGWQLLLYAPRIHHDLSLGINVLASPTPSDLCLHLHMPSGCNDSKAIRLLVLKHAYLYPAPQLS